MDFELKPVDQELLDKTEAEWTEQLEAHPGDLPPARFMQFIEWSRDHVDGQSTAGRGRAYCYALVREDSPTIAVALLSISYARPETNSPWLKVLEMRLEPQLDAMADNDDEEETLVKLSEILGAILLETFRLAHADFPSKELKVYGELPATRQFMEGIAVSLRDKGIKAKAHGNWLILRTFR